MTQVTFATGETGVGLIAKLNTAVQGYRFLRRSTFIGLTSPFIFDCTARTTAISVRLVGPGGGGAGAPAGNPSDLSAGSGGGGGGYYEFFSTDPALIHKTFTVIAPRGAVGGANGSPGTAQSSGASVTYRGTIAPVLLAFAGPGQGGFTLPPGNATNFVGGGNGGSVFNTFATAHDIFMPGEPGGPAFILGPDVALSGRGGTSRFGGGVFQPQGEPVDNSQSYGAGGVGNVAFGQFAVPGGQGGHAFVMLDEYY